MNPITLFTRIGDKVGSIDAMISTMSGAMCFPAITSLRGALGYFSRRQIFRSLSGMLGPAIAITLPLVSI